MSSEEPQSANSTSNTTSEAIHPKLAHMEPPPVTTSTKLPMGPVDVPPSFHTDVSKIFSQVITLNDQRILHEPTCLICASPYREDIESAYNKKNKYDDAVTYARKNGLLIQAADVENHIEFHVQGALAEIQKQEYIDRIRRLDVNTGTTLDRINTSLSILTERLIAINALVPDNENGRAKIEKIKTQETSRIMGSYNQLLRLQASILGEMKKDGEVLEIPTRHFIHTFNEAFNKSNTNEEKMLIRFILEKLKSSEVQ